MPNQEVYSDMLQILAELRAKLKFNSDYQMRIEAETLATKVKNTFNKDNVVGYGMDLKLRSDYNPDLAFIPVK